MAEVLIGWAFLAFLVACVWRARGFSFMGGLLVSILLSPVIGLVIGLVKRRPDEREIQQDELDAGLLKRCPSCAELIKREAVVCRHCGAKDIPIGRLTPMTSSQLAVKGIRIALIVGGLVVALAALAHWIGSAH